MELVGVYRNKLGFGGMKWIRAERHGDRCGYAGNDEMLWRSAEWRGDRCGWAEFDEVWWRDAEYGGDWLREWGLVV